jgi:xanthine dehydrogenase YagR molybdenum-binding subunit
MMQAAADALGLPVAKVRFELGDSRMPPAPVQGGSMTMASVGPAVQAAAAAARQMVLDLGGAGTYRDILKRHGKESVEATREAKPGDEGQGILDARFRRSLRRGARRSGPMHGARGARGDGPGRRADHQPEDSAQPGHRRRRGWPGHGASGGKHPRLAQRNGRLVNANLADYLVPVHADVPDLEAFYVEEDKHVNPLGAKGLAELSLVGVAPAVANAVYHATGKRVRELPITPEKLL